MFRKKKTEDGPDKLRDWLAAREEARDPSPVPEPKHWWQKRRKVIEPAVEEKEIS